MGYFVDPDVSAPGGIINWTWASNPPGTGTLSLFTIGCAFTDNISATARLSSQEYSLFAFWKSINEKKTL